MIDFIAHNAAPIIFLGVMLMLLLGYPVAFTLAAGGLIFFVFGVELADYSREITLSWPFLQALPERIYGIMQNDTLLAIPFFTFMGLVLERSRMAEDLLETIGQLFGPVRGGLAYAAVLVGALLAATTGVVAASVIAMGLISLPIMLRYNYNRSFATGTIAASGTLAQIVPPSLVLIVMADQLGRSVGDMYVGAIVPAALMIFAYCAYVFLITIFKPEWAPALPKEARTLGDGVLSLIVMIGLSIGLYFLTYHTIFADNRDEVRLVFAATTATLFAYLFSLINRFLKIGLLSRLAEQVIIVLIPPLALIFLVLGTIFLGIATPTEGGAMGATGALILAIAKKRLSFAVLRDSLDATTKLTAFVMFILIGARVFALTFYGVSGKIWAEELLLSVTGGDTTNFLLVVTILVFILGCFLDFFEIAFIIIPLLAPAAESLDIDLIWLGVILGINLQTSFLTPPFGFALFYLRSIAPVKKWRDDVSGRDIDGVKTTEIYKGAVPFIAINFAMIMLIIFYPNLVTHYKDDGPVVDPNSIEINIPSFGGGLDGGGLGGLGGGLGDGLGGGLGGGLDGAPSLGLPPLGTEPNAAQPSLGLPPLSFEQPSSEQPTSEQPTSEQPSVETNEN